MDPDDCKGCSHHREIGAVNWCDEHDERCINVINCEEYEESD